MSATDAEQEKQPISSINGQAVNIPGKDVSDQQTPSVEGIRDAAETETIKDDVGKTVELKSEQTLVNGVDQSVDKKEEGEPFENVRESPVKDTKPNEMQGEQWDEKNINGEGVKVETVKEGERSGECKDPEPSPEAVVGESNRDLGETSSESKKSEPSDDPVIIEVNAEEAATSAESKDSEPHSDPVITETSEEKVETSAESKDSQQSPESVVTERSEEKVETSAESKDSKKSPEPVAVEINKEKQDLSSAETMESEPSLEPVALKTNGEQVKTSVDSTHKESEQSPEPIAVEINGEQAKTEAVTTEVESTCTEAEKGEKGEVPDVTPSEQAENGDQLQSQTSEEAKATETEPDTGEKKRAMAIDSPGNVKEPDEADDKTKEGRSKTVGDIEGSATVKEDESNRCRTVWYTDLEDTPAKANSMPANAESTSSPEETVSYSTSIVGGVVHRVPINSNSPKGQRKPGEGSPQTTPKKKSVLGTLFGRRKKSKGGPESPPGSSPDARDDKKGEQEAEAGGTDKSVENENPQQPPKSSPVKCDAGADDAVKDATEPLSSGKGEEGVDTIGTDDKQEIEGKEAPAIEGGGEVETKPVAIEQGEERVKDETTQDSGEPKEVGTEPKEVREDATESTPHKTVKESTEESKDEGSKEPVRQTETDSPEEETKPHPTLKKKNSTGLFGGFFARRKSRKSKDSEASHPEEKTSDKEEEPQATASSALSEVEDTGTEQGVAPDTAAEKGLENSATPKQEAPEGLISPAVDQTVESAKEEIADKDKVDAPTVGEKTVATVVEKLEEESVLPEDVRKSSEEPSPSEEAGDMTEKSAEETEKPLEAGDRQPKEEGEHLVQPKVEVNNVATGKVEAVEDKPEVNEPKNDDAVKGTGEKPPPESGEGQDELIALREQSTLRNGGSLSRSPKTRLMQMRISYAEKDGEAGREVEVIGTPEKASETTSQKGKADQRVSCRALGEADHEGWLAKKGGRLFFSAWKHKWVVLKDGKLYCFKTSFDPEASNVINMEGVTVVEAAETRRKFCFKCEQPGPKAPVSLFMANSKEDRDKWLTVLTAASRGEVIHKPKQNQLTVSGDVTMRRKSGSSTAQRHSSVLAVGGRYDFLEDVEDLKTTRRRSTSGSFSRVPKETREEGKETSALTVVPPAPIDEQPQEPSDKPQVTNDAPASEPGDQQQVLTDAPPAPSAEQAVPSDAPSEPSGEQPAPSGTHLAPSSAPTDPSGEGQVPSDSPPAPSVACTDTPSAPSSELSASDSCPVSGPSDEAPEKNTVSEESKTTEKTIIVVTDEVFVGSDKVVVESTSTKVQVSTSESETVDVKSSQDDADPVVSNEKDKETKESLKITEEVTAITEKQDTSTEAESAVDKTDGAASVTTAESSVSEVETVKTSVEISETVETSTVVCVVETVVQETSESVRSELTEGSEATTSETSVQLESEPSETTPAEHSYVPPESPSKTKWYFSLDRKQTWSVSSEPEEEKSPKQSKSSTSKTSDRGSIKSTSSDNELIKSLPDDDELMVMCKNIRRARLSIVGDHVWDGQERLRAFSLAKESDNALVRLQTLERTLKDKEKHLAELEELLNQPEINRRSIYEWKLRNSDLLDELIPQANDEGQDEDENAAEGGEGEMQKQEDQEKPSAEKEKEDVSTEQVEDKSNETKEEPASSMEEGDGSVDEAQGAVETEVGGDGEQKSGEDEEQLEEKEKEKEKENENILTKEGAEGQQQGAHETSPPVEKETTDGKPDFEKDNSAEFSGEQKSGEDVQGHEDTFDTHF